MITWLFPQLKRHFLFSSESKVIFFSIALKVLLSINTQIWAKKNKELID